MTCQVRVDLGTRGYDVVIGPGALDGTADALKSLTARPSAIVADETVATHHGETLGGLLPGVPVITIPPGEASKGWATFERVCEDLLRAGVERGGCVVAFGGGVVGDLAGFCAATLRRGCGLVQVPTTLLSQVDSSVGGKTAINTRAGKNLVGAFHQPSLVIIDTRFLATLPRRELLAGYAEVIKYGALGDAAFFEWLEAQGPSVLALEEPALSRAIAESCKAKARIVAEDEREAGRRALLNLGHTFGHAIEAAAGYDGRVLHGEAVALGMAMAARFSEREGHMAKGGAARLETLLRRDGLPARMADLDGLAPTPAQLLAAMRQDKKVEDGAITLILMRAIGDAFVAPNQDRGRILDFLGEDVQLPAS